MRSADLAVPGRLLVEALNCGRRHPVLNPQRVSGINSESLGLTGLPWDPGGAGRRRPGGRPALRPPLQAAGGLNIEARLSSPGPTRHVVGAAGLAFVAATEQLDSGPFVVRVMGEVDLATVKELERALREARESRTGAVLVDLTGCTFLDSSGLRALVETRHRLERASLRLALVLSTPAVLRVFQITGLDHVFDIYPTLGAAVDGERVEEGSGVDPQPPRTLRDQAG